MKWISLCLAAVLFPAITHAATVHTKDGQDLKGELHLDPDSATVRAADGTESHFTLDQIAHIDFAPEPAAAQTDEPGLGGLKGEYFLGTNFDQTKRKLLRLDPSINFVWKYNRDAVLMPNEWTWAPFCVRWTGRIRPLFSEDYILRIRDPLPDGGDIHGRLWIDGKLVLNDGAEACQIHFEAGHMYDMKLESVAVHQDHRGRPSLVRLTWESRSQRRQIVPPTALFALPNAPDGPVVSRIISLPRDSMVYAPCDIPIDAKVEPGRRVLDRVDLQADASVLSILTNAPYHFDWKNPPVGDYQIGVTSITKDGGKWASGHARVIVADNDGGKIPKPWARFNIGDTSAEPATVTDQKITLSRTGGEFYTKQDKLQFVYQMLTGDGEITARLSDLTTDAPNAQAAAGLMIRRSLADNQRECAVLFQPGVGTVFLNRGFEGEVSQNSPAAATATGYLRLVRDGQIVRAYRSEDGSVWQFVDQKEIDFSATALIGVALSAQGAGRANATFDNVAVTAKGLHDYSDNAIGLTLVDGSRLSGDVTEIEKGVATLQRGDTKNRQRITVDLKSIARIDFHRPDTTATDQTDPAWHGVVLSRGDLFEGDVKIRSYHDIKVSSDVFGPRTFNAQNDLAAAVLAPVQPRQAAFDIALFDGSILHCDRVDFVGDGINVDTLFAKGLHIDVKELSELTAVAPPP
jgi:hypothetical protein